MKHITPSTALSLLCSFCVLTLYFGKSMVSHAQNPEQDIQQKIVSVVKLLKAEEKGNPKIGAALGIIAQVKIALNESDFSSIEALERNLMRQYDSKHQMAILEIIRRAGKKIALENTKSQEEWTNKIGSFIQKINSACIKDASLKNLEKLLLEADALKASQPKSRHRMTGGTKIEFSKFDSAVKLLDQWTEYKRYATSGYEKKASDIIRSLKTSAPNYPILEKSFLEKKYAEIERARATARMEKMPKSEISAYDSELKKIVASLGENALVSESILNAVEKLEIISARETDDYKINFQNRVNGSLRDLGDCLYYAGKEDLTRSRILLIDFIEETVSFKYLKPLRKKAAIQLLPVLYAKLGALPLTPDQNLTRYLFELASSPKSLDDITLRYSYMRFYKEFYDYKYRPGWVDEAENQFQSLTRAASAMRCQDYATALRFFRAALSNAAESGPTNAKKMIQAQIDTIRKLQPELFDPSLVDNLEKMEALERRINYYKAKLKKISTKK